MNSAESHKKVKIKIKKKIKKHPKRKIRIKPHPAVFVMFSLS